MTTVQHDTQIRQVSETALKPYQVWVCPIDGYDLNGREHHFEGLHGLVLVQEYHCQAKQFGRTAHTWERVSARNLTPQWNLKAEETCE
jgi:hypothetical protein